MKVNLDLHTHLLVSTKWTASYCLSSSTASILFIQRCSYQDFQGPTVNRPVREWRICPLSSIFHQPLSCGNHSLLFCAISFFSFIKRFLLFFEIFKKFYSSLFERDGTKLFCKYLFYSQNNEFCNRFKISIEFFPRLLIAKSFKLKNVLFKILFKISNFLSLRNKTLIFNLFDLFYDLKFGISGKSLNVLAIVYHW